MVVPPIMVPGPPGPNAPIRTVVLSYVTVVSDVDPELDIAVLWTKFKMSNVTLNAAATTLLGLSGPPARLVAVPVTNRDRSMIATASQFSLTARSAPMSSPSLTGPSGERAVPRVATE